MEGVIVAGQVAGAAVAVVILLGVVWKALRGAVRMHDVITSQLLANGGSSLVDKVDAQGEKLRDHDRQFEAGSARFDRIDRALHDLLARDRRGE